MTKKKIVIFIAILILILIGAMAAIKLWPSDTATSASSGSQLKMSDGTFVGTEKTDMGAIQIEMNIKKGKIKDIKLIQFPESEYAKDSELKDGVQSLLKDVKKKQDVNIEIDTSKSSAFLLTKVLQAVKNATQQSTLTQIQ